MEQEKAERRSRFWRKDTLRMLAMSLSSTLRVLRDGGSGGGEVGSWGRAQRRATGARAARSAHAPLFLEGGDAPELGRVLGVPRVHPHAGHGVEGEDEIVGVVARRHREEAGELDLVLVEVRLGLAREQDGRHHLALEHLLDGHLEDVAAHLRAVTGVGRERARPLTRATDTRAARAPRRTSTCSAVLAKLYFARNSWRSLTPS